MLRKKQFSMQVRPIIKCIYTLVLVCCLCSASAGIVFADSEYDVRAENAIDTPRYSPTGLTANADHIGVFEQDGSIDVTITGPDESYQVGIFNSDNELVYEDNTDRTVSFDITEHALDPGSYVLRVTDPALDEVVPIVVSGYDISVDLTKSSESNELTIRATATETSLSEPPEAVEAVVWNDDDQNRVDLTKQSESSSSTNYETTVPFSDLEGGSYEVYVVATGENKMYTGNNEIVGVSEPVSIDVPDDGGSDDSGSNNGSNADDGSNEEDGTSASDETNQDETNEENETVVDDKINTDDMSNEENETDSSDSSNEEDETDDDSSVIQPNNTGDNNSTDVDGTSNGQTDDDTPHSPVIAIISLLLTALIIVHRQ
jgi:hypothetical protein